VLVQDDVPVLRTGDQIVADGPIIDKGSVQVDESLLTGESEPITKRSGDWLSSGSFCLSGAACYRTESIGMTSVAGQLTSKARAYRRMLTPLQRRITVIMQVLLLIALYIEIVLLMISLANRNERRTASSSPGSLYLTDVEQ
jgi:cation-transporting ATPase E